jgi:hypothetical protein
MFKLQRVGVLLCAVLVGLNGISVFGQGKKLQDPKELPGLVLWLDAADAKAVTKDAADKVNAWADKSASKTDFKAGTEQQPLFSATGINGKPAIVFDGAKTMFEGPVLKGVTFTVIGVLKPGKLTVAEHTWITTRVGTDSGIECGITNGGSPMIRCYAADNAQFNAVGTTGKLETPIIATYVVAGKDNSASITSYNNGKKGGENPKAKISASPATAYIGKIQGSSGAGQWLGCIGEVLVYNRLLDDSERKGVEKYLSDKWEIKLSE